jgi:hypothetical protein
MMEVSITRAGTTYHLSDVAEKDVPKVPENKIRSIFAAALMTDPLKMEKSTTQLSTNTNAAQAVADAAAEEAAAGVSHDLHAAAKKAAANAAAPERVAAEAAATVNNMSGEIKHLQLLLSTERAIFHAAPESAIAVQAVIDPFKRVAIKADAEAAATVNNMRGEIKRLQLLLATERAAATAARAAADEAAATINKLEVENKRILRLLAAEQAATTVKVYVPGYNIPMTHAEHLAALQRQIQYLQEQLYAQAIPAQWQAHKAIIAETVNAAETMASSSPVPVFANEPPWKEHIQSQPGATIAKSNPTTYAQAVTNSEPSLSSTMKRSLRAQDIDRDHSANAASASATADPASAIMMSPTALQHNLADHAKAAALQAAADAATAAATNPKILRAVLLAAAATANALASTIPLDAVPTHRRGGRPPKTRRANARPRPRRTRRPTGMHTGAPAPTADSTSTARQSSQHSAFADSPPRAGQARPRPGARPPRFDSTRSTTLATRQILPKVEPTVMRLNGRD